jgi:hypothetical protein
MNELRERLASPDYAVIPEHTRRALLNYVEYRLPPGHAIQALLANDLWTFVGRADAETLAAVRQLVWALGYCPSACQGSQAKVATWLEARFASVEDDDGEPEPNHDYRPGADGPC